MEKITKVLDLLKQRRIWIAIIMAVSFGLTISHKEIGLDPDALADSLVKVATAIGDLVAAGLAIWSLLKPKQ